LFHLLESQNVWPPGFYDLGHSLFAVPSAVDVIGHDNRPLLVSGAKVWDELGSEEHQKTGGAK
jgi:hypothetical protein